MTTLNVNGQSVQVDDSFLKMSPADQQSTVDEIAKSIPQQNAQSSSQPQTSTVADVLKSGASGAARGALDLAGLPGTVGDALNSAGQWALRNGYGLVEGKQPDPYSQSGVERFFAGPQPQISQAMIGGGSNPLSAANLEGDASALTNGATAYQPQTTPGKYAATVGEFLPSAALGGVNPANLIKTGVLPALGSEAAGQATQGTGLEPFARVAGALVGGGAAQLASAPLKTATGQTARDILDQGADLYQQSKPVLQQTAIDNPAYRKIATDLADTTTDFGPVPGQHDALTNLVTGHVNQANSGATPTLADLETVRKQLVNAGKTLDPSVGALSSKLIDTLDNNIEGLQPSSIVGNVQNANQALSQLQDARSLWRTGRKAQIIQNAIEQGQNAASGAENGIRNQFRALLKPKYASTFSGAEKTAIAKVANGTPLSNAARFVGTMGIPLDNGRNWLGAMAGMHFGGIPATVAGTGARIVSRGMTESAANVADQIVKAGPQAQQVFNQLTQGASQAAKTAILRSFLQSRQALAQPTQGQSAGYNHPVPLAIR